MKSNWKLVTAVAVGAAALGVGGAVAATRLITPGERSQAVVNDAASQLGVDPAKLSAALKKALENQIDADVAAGRITKEDGEAMKRRIESSDYPLFGGPRKLGVLGGFGKLGVFPGPGHLKLFRGLDAAASYLGVTREQLRAELAGGKTLAQVAADKGKSVDGLVDAIVAETKKKVAAAVAAGDLTQADADRVLTDLEQRVTHRVNGVGGPGPGFGFGHGMVFGGLEPAASYLGLTQAELRSELMSGKTLADVAAAKGKSVDGLVEALMAETKTRVAAGVAAGRLTQADADEVLRDLKQRVTDRVNGVRGPDGLRGFRDGGPDFGGPLPFGPPA